MILLAGSVIQQIPRSASESIGQEERIKVDAPEFYLRAGESDTRNIVVTATRGSMLVIDNVSIEPANDWVKIGRERTIVSKPYEYHYIEIPVTVTVPTNYVGNEIIVPVSIDARIVNESMATQFTSIRVVVDDSHFDPIVPIVVSAIIGGAIVGAYLVKRNRSKSIGKRT